MSQEVPVKDLELREALSALCTGVGTLSAVGLLVLIQKPHVGEAFPTLTWKWPLTCVFHMVSLQVRGSAIELLTHGTFVLTPYDVPLPVPQPIQDAAKALTAFLAFILSAPLL